MRPDGVVVDEPGVEIGLQRLDRQVRNAAREDAVRRRRMTVPGVGPVVALTFRSTIDEPARFRSSRSVGAFLGSTPKRHQSGGTDRVGAISKVGGATARVALFEAAHVLLTRVASGRPEGPGRMAGAKSAKVAVARKLLRVPNRMWVSDADFHHGTPTPALED